LTAGYAAAVRTHDEIADAIRALTHAQWARLRLVAEKYAWRCPLGPDDLLQEAFLRALEGGRKCPAHVDVVRFLAEAMRSIADGEAEKIENQVVLTPIAQFGDEQDGAVDPEEPRLNAENAAMCKQNVAALRNAMLALFNDDSQARDLVEGIMEDFTAEELRKLTELDETAYASKRRLMRRTIDKHYPKGWKP
jgi:DNA-directed RNA polymerase specialized sigma24 family protein